MDILEEHYYTILNIILLKALGIWPHDESRLVLLQRILVIVLTVTHTGLQVLNPSALTMSKLLNRK